jgi:hypothetical protein
LGWGVKVDYSLRSSIYALLFGLVVSPASAQELALTPVADLRSEAPVSEFELGGSIERTARALAPMPTSPQSRAALTLPLNPANSTRRETSLGGVVIYADEGWDDGRDAFRLGTAFTQGAATAGVSVTYLDEGAEVSRSELYVDYAFSQNFSVGLAGILDNDFTDQDSPIPQLGLNAAYETDGGAFFEGEISNADSAEPLFGLSIGLRF